jgi:hypothetical protein
LSRGERGGRAEQARAAAQDAYRASRRYRRPVIVMVPGLPPADDPNRQTQRPILIQSQPRPLSWREARDVGAASARILDGQVPHPPADDLPPKKTTSHRPKRRAPYKRDSRGEWWMAHLADAVERRDVAGTPKGRARKNRRKSRPGEPKFKVRETAPQPTDAP